VIFKNLFTSLNKARSRLLIINCLIIVILLNLLVNILNLRLDLTQNRIHSLSPATKKILQELDDIVTIKVFLSEEIPEQLIPIKTNLAWFVQTYEKNSKGKIKVKTVDPTKSKETEREANSLGIPPLEFSTLKKDKFEVTRGYLAVAVSYGDKNEVISALQDLPNLEYHLTSAIRKVTRDQLKTVAFSEGFGETELEEISLTRRILSKSYEWQVVNLAGEEVQFNPQVDVLVVNAPQKEVSQEAKKVIDQYLQNQKGVLLLLERYRVDNNLFPLKVNHGLDDFIQHYGITLEEGLVLDRSAAMAGFRTAQGGLFIPYPYWIKIVPAGFNSQQTPSSSLQSLTLPWASPLKLDKEATWLVKTTPRAWRQTAVSNLSPTQEFHPPAEEEKEFVLAAIQTHSLPPFLAKEDHKEDQPLKLAVVSDGDFIKDNFVKDNEGNLQFFLNLVDFLAQEKDLTEIRSKPVISRPLRPLSDQTKQLVKIANLAGPLLLLLLVYLIIKARRNALLAKKI